MKFSSDVRYVPQGVIAAGAVVEGAQHRNDRVGRLRFSSVRGPAAGPLDQGGRVGCDAACPGRGCHHLTCRSFSCRSQIDTPWAACDLRTFSRLQLAAPSGNSRPWSHTRGSWPASPPGAFLRKVVDAVVVHAKRVACWRRCCWRRPERGVFARHAHRVTPKGQSPARCSPLGHRHRIGRGKGHALKPRKQGPAPEPGWHNPPRAAAPATVLSGARKLPANAPKPPRNKVRREGLDTSWMLG